MMPSMSGLNGYFNNEQDDDDYSGSSKGLAYSGDSQHYSDDPDDGANSVRSHLLTSYKARREECKRVRNAMVSKLELELNHVWDQTEDLKIELEFRRSAGEGARADHSKKVEDANRMIESIMWKYDKISNQDTQRRSSLGGYVSTMRGVTGPGSMYVQTIEGQTCRSLHLLEVRKKQRDLMNRQAQELVQSMKRSMQELKDEKAELSKNGATKSFEIECDQREYASRCEMILKKQGMLIVSLEAKLWQSSFLGTDWMGVDELSSHSVVLSELSRRPRRRASIGFSPSISKETKRELCARRCSSETFDEDDVNDMIEEVANEAPKRSRRPARRSSLGGMVSSFLFPGSGDNSTPSPLKVAAVDPTGLDENADQRLPSEAWNLLLEGAPATQRFAA